MVRQAPVICVIDGSAYSSGCMVNGLLSYYVQYIEKCWCHVDFTSSSLLVILLSFLYSPAGQDCMAETTWVDLRLVYDVRHGSMRLNHHPTRESGGRGGSWR